MLQQNNTQLSHRNGTRRAARALLWGGAVFVLCLAAYSWTLYPSAAQTQAARLESRQNEKEAQSGLTAPRALVAIDADADGVPDVLSGHVRPDGGGAVYLQRGNMDALYPNAPEAQQRGTAGTFSDAPLFAPVWVANVPEAADFLGAGDFDADGFPDVITARRGGTSLYFLRGDSAGHFAPAQAIATGGAITAFTVGEINRADGLPDIVLATTGATGHAPQVLIYEGPEGALRARPEVLLVPQPVQAVALGRLNTGDARDLAIATDSQLFVVAGRDRKLSLDATQQAHVAPPRIAVRTKAALAITKDGASVLAQLTPVTATDAVLSMRLNADAFDDLVIWHEGQSAPEFKLSAPTATFVVNSTADTDDGACTTNPGGCTLREALNAANNSSGADTIIFNISTGTQTRTINLVASLFATDAVTIDATTEPGYNGTPLIELRGNPANSATEEGLVITGGNSVVRGLAFGNFRVPNVVAQALVLEGAGHNFVEGNVFGPREAELNFESLEVAAPDTLIGGTAAPARNLVLSSVRGVHVSLPASDARIQGNRIAVNPNNVRRTSDNSLSGIIIGDSNTTVSSPVLVGGTVAGARNIIQSCLNRVSNTEAEGFGVIIGAGRQGVLVQGNYIGTDDTGQTAQGNGYGIFTESRAEPTLGGTTPAARNVISSNQIGGIFTGGSLIQGNYIGLNANGTAALGNFGAGIHQGDTLRGSTIGGAVAGARNVVSGNGTNPLSDERDGLRLLSGCANSTCTGAATPTLVQGNYIGTDAAGTVALPNAEHGVLLAVLNGPGGSAPGPITIGGPSVTTRNVISGNGLDGVRLGLGDSPIPLPGGTGIVIQNNYLGTDATGTANLGNQRNGLLVDANCVHNSIADNVIAFNAANGINIIAVPSPGLEIEMGRNAIFGNGLLGINLGPEGVTPNDLGDGDDGANRLQNFPVLSSSFAPVAPDRSNRALPQAPQISLSINGTLNSNANTTYTIQWYFSSVASCANNQNGPPLVSGRIPGVRTDAAGNAAFSFPLEFPGGITSGTVNATATDPFGNTSEFSQCQAVSAPAATNTFQFSAGTYDANEGDGQTTFTVTRTGNLSAAATIDYATADLSAEQRSDYAAASGTLSFASNETSKTFAVLLIDDVYPEGFEQFSLKLSNALGNGAGLGTRSQATVTVTDNDPSNTNNRHFTARLVGAQVVPPFDFANIPTGSGTASLTLNDAETQATLNLSVTGLSSTQTAAHLHGPGLVGASAPSLFTVANGVSTISLTPAQVADLRAGRWYLDVHTANNPNGELRGQIMNALPDDPSFFVRQQYADFLSRTPDAGGVNYWTQELVRCANNPAACPVGSNATRRRWEVSNAFFFEAEYQKTGAYVFRLYRAAYGNSQPFPNPNGDLDTHPYCTANPANCQLVRAAHVPAYQQYAVDRARLNADASQLAATQLALAQSFAQRPEFAARYPAALTGPQFVDAVLANVQSSSGVNLASQRDALLAQFSSGGRGAVLYRLADDNETGNPINNRMLIDAEYNRTFVTTQYYGYLRRDADLPGLNFWFGVINARPPCDGVRQLGMVCAFITSAEYQQRFGAVTPRSNGECPQ